MPHFSQSIDSVSQFLDSPIATYTHSSNHEIVVSAIDVATNTFTSVEHGLNNGDTIYPILNTDAGNLYPIAVYAGGLVQTEYGYYVINKTDDDFQLSESYEGLAIDITLNPTMDITKWHFEKAYVNSDITITNLPPSKYYRLVINGRCLQLNAGTHVLVNGNELAEEYLVTDCEMYANPSTKCNGDLANYCKIDIDYTKYLTILVKGYRFVSYTNSTNTYAEMDKTIISPKYFNKDITSITLKFCTPANGLKVEVY